MTKLDVDASEVCFLSPDIRLERSECTARTGSPLSTSYLGDAGIKISGYGITKQRAHVLTTRHARMSDYAHQMPLLASLVGCREYVCDCE